MKAKILEALKPKFEGVSESILERIATKLSKTTTNDEDVATIVEGVTFQQVLESYGDSRANEAQKSAVSNYEKKHGLKDGKSVKQTTEPNEPPMPKGNEGEDVPSWAKSLIESNKALQEKLASIEGEKTANNRKSSLNKVLGNAPEKIRQRYEKDFARMSFTDEEDFNNWIEEIKPDVESIVNDFNTKGGVVSRPKVGGGNNQNQEINPHLKARIAEQEAEPKSSAIVGGGVGK